MFPEACKMYMCDRQDHFRLIEYINTNSKNILKVGKMSYRNPSAISLLYGSVESATLVLRR